MKLVSEIAFTTEERKQLDQLEWNGLALVENYEPVAPETVYRVGLSVRKEWQHLATGPLQRALALACLRTVTAGSLTNRSEDEEEYGPPIPSRHLYDLAEWIRRARIVTVRESQMAYWEAIPDGDMNQQERAIADALVPVREQMTAALADAHKLIADAILLVEADNGSRADDEDRWGEERGIG